TIGHLNRGQELFSCIISDYWWFINADNSNSFNQVRDERPVHLVDPSVNVEIIESHISNDVEEKVNRCEICDRDFNNLRGLKWHNTWKHSSRSTNRDKSVVQEVDSVEVDDESS
ncbi:unnamed protein product, partial [Brachionus calyciflorus]